MPHVACPDCSARLRVPDGAAGERVRCRTCGAVFRAGAGRPAATPPAARRAGRRPHNPAGRALLGGALAAVLGLAWHRVGPLIVGGRPDGPPAAASAPRGPAAGPWVPPVPAESADRGKDLRTGRRGTGRRERERAGERWESGHDPLPPDRVGELAPWQRDIPAADDPHWREVATRQSIRAADPDRSYRSTITLNRGSGDWVYSGSERLGGSGAVRPVFVLPEGGPCVAVRIGRGRYGGTVALRTIELLTDRGGAADLYPGEAADAAPPGFTLGGFEVAHGRYVYAVRPLWVPADAPAGRVPDARDGAWLGSPGGHVTTPLLPETGRFEGLVVGTGAIVDSVGLLLTPDEPPAAADIGGRGVRPGSAATPSRPDGTPGADDLVDLKKVGGDGGFPFRETANGRTIVAVRVDFGEWSGTSGPARITLLPHRGAAGESSADHVWAVAPDSFTLGGLEVAHGKYVAALRPLWVPEWIAADPAAIREGSWIGSPAGHTVTRLLPEGGAFAGVHGRKASLLDSIGLVVRPDR